MTLENHKAAFVIQNPKEMNYKARLKVAKKWAESVDTLKKIKAYVKFFGVDKLCAAKELLQAGDELSFESDDFFYYVAGYTEGGTPYGITWEEAEANAMISGEHCE